MLAAMPSLVSENSTSYCKHTPLTGVPKSVKQNELFGNDTSLFPPIPSHPIPRFLGLILMIEPEHTEGVAK
ncbi:hypothetical protein V6N12_071544 [Hibiscus sabdariffa]|uniref:Uncharacterized protein n=1 Tax=Hibiscus sabdariffa TaxID=183260 RepID=A0ABR2FKB7_9ROSI